MAQRVSMPVREQSQWEINGDQRWSAAAWWRGGWQRVCGVAARPRQAIAEKGATIVIVLTVMRAVSWGEKGEC